MSTLPMSFLLKLINDTLPQFPEVCAMHHRGEPTPEALQHHPNYSDRGRSEISRSAFCVVMDLIIIADTTDAEREEAYKFFGLPEKKWAVIAEAVTAIQPPITMEELVDLRDAVSKYEAIAERLPPTLAALITGLNSGKVALMHARYDAIGEALTTVSKLLTCAEEIVEEAEAARSNSGSDVLDAIERARAASGAVCFELGPNGIRVVAEGDVDEVFKNANDIIDRIEQATQGEDAPTE